MCGIFGLQSNQIVEQRVIDGLERLEYRGYDSCGIAGVVSGDISCRRSVGRVSRLRALLKREPVETNTAIGHTRWATHGEANVRNAHPQTTAHVAVVHNGIVANHREHRARLEATHNFTSETDTEVIAAMLTDSVRRGATPLAAIRNAMRTLEGDFAVAMIFASHPDELYVACHGNPLIVAHGDGVAAVSSDESALSVLDGAQCLALEHSEIAVLRQGRVELLSAETPAHQRWNAVRGFSELPQGQDRTLAEIREQPKVLAAKQAEPPAPPDFRPFEAQLRRLTCVACGTSRYAAMVARHWFERLGRVAVDVETASEFAHRVIEPQDGYAALTISQSGETADTLAAQRLLRAQGVPCAAVVNVPTSTMAREADAVVNVGAGPEFGVASTKAFTAQLATLARFALNIAEAKRTVSESERQLFLEELAAVPKAVALALELEAEVERYTLELLKAPPPVFIGRGASHAVALEGALKLKELTYLPALGIAAGELKHGPLALIDRGTPVIALCPDDETAIDMEHTVAEVRARGASVVVIGPEPIAGATHHWRTPALGSLWSPFVTVIPLQLLAYHAAKALGHDVDRPRNLAKSVTVR